MSQGRRINLAKLSIERDFNVDFNTVIEKCAQMKSRRFLINLSKGALWWWGGVLGAAAGEGVNTQLLGDRHSCQIISGRTIR